jgi:hypothetical protein
VAEKLRARGYVVSSEDVTQFGLLRQAKPEVVILADTDASEGIGQLSPARMAAVLENTWYDMPPRAQIAASNLIDSIVVTRPDDPRLSLSPRVSKPTAALYGTALLLPCDSEPEEIWHEIGHAIADGGLTSSEAKAIDRFYDFSTEQLPSPEVLAEDFYFMVRGDKTSPFWAWWFMGGDLSEMAEKRPERVADIMRVAGDLQPLDIVEAVLDAFAELVFDMGDEQYVWFYGIAKDALLSARKEDQLAYEDRGGPHQYYFHDDVSRDNAPSRTNPMNQPLRVERPDVTIRSTAPTSPGPGMM